MVWCDDKEFPLEDQKPRATNNGGNCFFFLCLIINQIKIHDLAHINPNKSMYRTA
jgi:hypothetical protein